MHIEAGLVHRPCPEILAEGAGWGGCAGVTLSLFWCRGGPRPTEKMVEAKKAELLAALYKEGVKADASASPQLLQYDLLPPCTCSSPPFFPECGRVQ